MISISHVLNARNRIAGRVLHTPMREARGLSQRAGAPVLIKCEHHQTTGSFKLRGATNAVLSLSEAARQAGVVAASTGNHGRAVAHASKATGVKAVICMSKLVPDNKLRAVEALGAEVRIVGAKPGRRPARGRPAGARTGHDRNLAFRRRRGHRRARHARPRDHRGRAGSRHGGGPPFRRRAHLRRRPGGQDARPRRAR